MLAIYAYAIKAVTIVSFAMQGCDQTTGGADLGRQLAEVTRQLADLRRSANATEEQNEGIVNVLLAELEELTLKLKVSEVSCWLC